MAAMSGPPSPALGWPLLARAMLSPHSDGHACSWQSLCSSRQHRLAHSYPLPSLNMRPTKAESDMGRELLELDEPRSKQLRWPFYTAFGMLLFFGIVELGMLSYIIAYVQGPNRGL